MNEHEKVQKHISAAKKWLTQAENSLAEENEVQGDLKLMLAQAELQRAKAKKVDSFWLRCVKRLAPLLAAMMLAAAYMLYIKSEYEEPAVPKTLPQTVHTVNTGYSVQPVQEVLTADSVPQTVQVDLESEYEIELDGAANTSASHIEETYSNAVNVEKATQQGTPAVPSAKMQELMQSAGSVLRE